MRTINNVVSGGTMTYESEYKDTIRSLLEENPQIKELSYFTDLADKWMDREKRRMAAPEIVVLGTGVPEELIYAAGAKPYWVLGGSHVSCSWSDDLVPRDADPVHRSILGFLQEENGADYSKSLFLIPVSCDSMRKLSFILKRSGRKVLDIDIPPVKGDPYSLRKWERQMQICADAVSSHVHGKITGRSVREARKMVNEARQELYILEEAKRTAAEGKMTVGSSLSDAGRMFVRNTYYYTDNLPEWTGHLRALNAELAGKDSGMHQGCTPVPEERPGILLMGSPVLFPNYKVPFLIRDIGLRIVSSVDVTSLRPDPYTEEKSLRELTDSFYLESGSAAYLCDTALRVKVLSLMQAGGIEGVVVHVLKGQIEYDFELPWFEKLFERFGVPVFRLETDYVYQDVEQIRIRMEAFSEMLRQNRLKAANRSEEIA